jgi:hypothetical protein
MLSIITTTNSMNTSSTFGSILNACEFFKTLMYLLINTNAKAKTGIANFKTASVA